MSDSACGIGVPVSMSRLIGNDAKLRRRAPRCERIPAFILCDSSNSTFLEYLFEKKTVLFVGYGLEELEILEYIIQKARRAGPENEAEARHFMLQGFYSHEFELMRSLSSYYREECGIQLIPFCRDRKDYRQLLDVLDKFAEIAPASEPLHLQKLMEMEGLLDD